MMSTWIAVCLFSLGSMQDDDLSQSSEQRLGELQAFLQDPSEDALQTFLERSVDQSLRKQTGDIEVKKTLQEIHQIVGRAGEILFSVPEPALVLLEVGSDAGGFRFEFALDRSAPYRVISIEKEAVEPEPERPLRSLSWASLEQELAEAEGRGFSGCVLVVRDGSLVLHRGYGRARANPDVKNSQQTLFAIGSTPIDFTKAAILKLWEGEKLSLDQPITDFFEGVPKDKKDILIEHLMNGRSGLRNFHGRPEDDDHDLTYIDREEAVRRIFEGPLLFKPGEGYAHSHSAWGILAAVVEIVSGESYDDFLMSEFFEIAGMERTGPFPLADAFDTEEVAMGLSGRPVGEINAPTHWGETSWLVLGSGGMVSNPLDLYRWNRALWRGKLLGPEALKKYWGPKGQVCAGGNDRGFLCIYTEGPSNLFILCSNSHSESGDEPSRLGRRLVNLLTR